MIKKILFLIVITFVFLRGAEAKYDPRSTPNNQFGIHVVDPTDIDGVEKMLNSNGGSWGYVKFVIPETDRNTDKWNSVFRELRRRKLIPVVRLATHMKDDGWARPTEESLRDWPAFLNTLSWPIENRYVVLFNEPNHSKEWGGEIDPENFAQTTVNLARKLKEANEDYFILPAGLDVSAQTDGASMTADVFMKKIYEKVPEYYDVIDGWNSHSYPNPNFSSPPTFTGRGSLRSYQWERTFLRNLGITKDYPVMIGETGWSHRDGLAKTPDLLSTDTVAAYIETAGNTVWRDPSVFSVIPFLYNYQSQPFDIFSWKKPGGNEFHPQYTAYQNLQKSEGQPKQRESYELLNAPLPKSLVAGSEYEFTIELKNTGQAIINDVEKYFLFFEDESRQFTFQVNAIPTLEPEQSARITMTLSTPEKAGVYPVSLKLQHGDVTYGLTEGTIELIPPPALKINVQLGWKRNSDAPETTVLIYDGDKLIQAYRKLSLDHGTIGTPGILSVVPGNYYRIVTIVPYYLPRQTIQKIGEQVTLVDNNRFFPIDLNNDQKLNWEDVKLFIQQSPADVLPRFF